MAAYLLKMTREGSDKIRQRFIPAWLTNLRLLWWISTEGACGAWCLWSTMGNSWGYDALLPPECGDAMGHWDLPLPGSWSCHDRAHAQHVKACIPIKFHQLFITAIIVTIFNRMRCERCKAFKDPIGLFSIRILLRRASVYGENVKVGASEPIIWVYRLLLCTLGTIVPNLNWLTETAICCQYGFC